MRVSSPIALRAAIASTVSLAFFLQALAIQPERRASGFDRLVIPDPSKTLESATKSVDDLPAGDPSRAGWNRFRSESGPLWSVYLDPRSGAPLLAEGSGISWIPGSGNALTSGTRPGLDSLERSLREFMAGHRSILLAADGELVLNRRASGPMTPDTWQVVFDRAIEGVPVDGERYLFVIGHGNLISFGAPRWSGPVAPLQPAIDAAEGLARIERYMQIAPGADPQVLRGGDLLYLPVGAPGDPGPYRGAIGAGYSAILVRVYALRVDGEPGTWVGYVDARDGSIRAFFDDNRYAQVKGGVFPVSNDGICPSGCEQTGTPMPFADILADFLQTASSFGTFNCPPGGSTAMTKLSGRYVSVVDTCGALSETATCGTDIDLASSPGTDCAIPSGHSAGDTHSARTGFYHLNRIAEHGRAWLPSNTWLNQQIVDNVNLNATCNAFWDGSSVNFYKSGGGCNNTGEIAGVFLHEWGHGLDQNDGGGFDSPSEAYADITSILSTHVSCLGRGFLQSGTCTGSGNACLTCTGVRDLDWDQRANHTPSTPSGFVTSACAADGSGYNGPCGREQHCEGYVGGETLWDLAVRDLPASGLDAATSWQLADRLWYLSRNGSGGNAYTCSLPSSDGCAVNSWFSKLRAIDDDDGNLANGTPHAAAIFAAFKRHAIACGLVGDASNLSTSSCPAIGTATLTAASTSSSASLSWTAVPNASSYTVLHNDAGCSAGFTIAGTVTAPTTNFTETGLANGSPVYYRVQANGLNTSCQGAVSSCQTVTPQAFAGSIALDGSVYTCSSLVTVTVTDENVGASTTSVTFVSGTEPAGETITLTETPAGSGTYSGTILLTSLPPAADGTLSVTHGDAVTATYVDANDGLGGFNLNRQATAAVDCGLPTVSCTGGGGNWSSTASWSGGSVPGANDTVMIANGCTITLDTNASVRRLTVGQGTSGVLQFDATAARTLTVASSVTIAPGATIQSATSGTVTTHRLSIGGDLVVNGTLDLSTNANTAGAELRFTGLSNNTFSGTGPTADLRLLSLSKGAAGNVLEITRPFTVRGAAGNDTVGFLAASPYVGTLEISGAATYSSIVFPTPGWTIPATGGLWLNEPGFTVTAQAASATLAGLMRLSAGTFNVGTASGHSLNTSTGAVVTIEGGALNVTGRFGVSAPTNSLTYTQIDGTVTVSTIGHASSNASFDVGSSLSSFFFMNGGTIVIRIPNSTTTGARDYRVSPGSGNIIDGIVQFGDALSGPAKIFGIGGPNSSTWTYFPNLVVSNASAGHTLQVVVGPVWGGNVFINPSTTLNLRDFELLLTGNLTNNGTITGTIDLSSLHFLNSFGDFAQAISGSGAFPDRLGNLSIDNPAGVTLGQTNAIILTHVGLLRGTLKNSNKVTLGNGPGTGIVITQIGAPGLATTGGHYDVAPTFNPGAGGVGVLYSQEGAPRTTGLEIPPSRTLASMTISNPNGVTLAGGGITITSSLSLSNGRFNTSAANMPTLGSSVSAPAGSATSYVNGPLAIQVNSLTNLTRTFGIGSPAGWLPVVLGNFHSNGTLQTYTAQVLEGSTGGTPAAPLVYLDPARSVRIQNTTNLFSTTTATVQLSYLPPELTGPTATARIAQSPSPAGSYTSRGGATSSFPTTGIVSTTPITMGDQYFVIANEAAVPGNETCASLAALSLDTPVSGSTHNGRDDYELTGSACFTSQGQLGNVASTATGPDVVYSFTAPSAGRYSFRITNAEAGDPVLYTASSCPASTFPTAVVVGTCVSAANRRTSRAEEVSCQTMASGQTIFAIVDETTSTGASFDIEVNACTPEVNPNDSPATAIPLLCGAEATITDSSDSDFYALGTPGSGSRVFAMIDAVASALDDTTLRLTDSSDTYEVDFDDGDTSYGVNGLESVLGGAVAPSGQAYLKVSGAGPIEPYRLYAVVQPPLATAAFETEPNDTAATANSSPGNYFEAILLQGSASGDTDFYSFTANAGDLVFLAVDSDAERNVDAASPYLSLVAPDGVTPLASVGPSSTIETPSPNPGLGLDASTPRFAGTGLVYRVRSSGTYFAKVVGLGGGPPKPFDYALSITRNCTLPTDLTIPQQVPSTGTVSGGSNVTYTVTVTNSGTNAAPSVSVTDTIPVNMTFVSASAPAGWSCGGPGGGQVVCSVAALAPSSPANLQFTYKANFCTGNIQTTHTTTVSSAATDPVLSNNSSSIQTNITDSLDCNDGNACTVDSCNPLTGCLNTAGPSAAVGNTVRLAYASGTTTISWTGEATPPFNVYRGLKPVSTWSYNHTCLASGVAGTSTTDSGVPPADRLQYYLVSRKAALCSESSLGQQRDGTEIPNSSPCP